MYPVHIHLCMYSIYCTLCVFTFSFPEPSSSAELFLPSSSSSCCYTHREKSLLFHSLCASVCTCRLTSGATRNIPPPSPFFFHNITIGTHQWCFIARLGRISLFSVGLFLFLNSFFFSSFRSTRVRFQKEIFFVCARALFFQERRRRNPGRFYTAAAL